MSTVTNAERKQELALRMSNVTLAEADNYKTKKETQERRKCTQCGKGYLGQKNSSTCGDACRQKKSRT